MQAQARDPRWTPVPVVARVLDELEVRAELHILAELRPVIGLEGLLIAIVEAPIAEAEAAATRREIGAMFTGKPLVADSQSHPIILAPPVHARELATDAQVLV